MCNRCGYSVCTCPCDTCDSCPLKLDFSCIIYNKDGNTASNLDGLNLPNGSTLRLVIETIDEKIKQVDVINNSLTYLRGSYTITTLKQFTEAVDDELDALNTAIGALSAPASVSLVAQDSASIDFSTSGTLSHTLTGSVKLHTALDNQLTIESDGLYGHPQTLSVNYTTKEITISDGNTINLTSLVSTPSGFLGNVTTDPSSPNNGNYWYNTSTSTLKIKIGGVVKEILTT